MMLTFEVIPIAIDHVADFHKVLDNVAKNNSTYYSPKRHL